MDRIKGRNAPLTSTTPWREGKSLRSIRVPQPVYAQLLPMNMSDALYGRIY